MKKDDSQLKFDFQEIEKELDAKFHRSPEKIKNTIQKVKGNKENINLPSYLKGFKVKEACGQRPQALFFDNQIYKLLSTREASGLLGVSENALRILVCRRRIKVYKLGNRLRFKFGDLMDCLQQKEV